MNRYFIPLSLKKILLIEDDEGTNLIISRKIHQCGYLCECVTSGKEGLELLKKEPYDLIILDFFLGDMSAFEFIDLCSQKGMDGPFTVISAQWDHPIEDKLKTLGVLGFFEKNSRFLENVALYLCRLDYLLSEEFLSLGIERKKLVLSEFEKRGEEWGLSFLGEEIDGQFFDKNFSKEPSSFLAFLGHDLKNSILSWLESEEELHLSLSFQNEYKGTIHFRKLRLYSSSTGHFIQQVALYCKP